jgi:hypothetical protein
MKQTRGAALAWAVPSVALDGVPGGGRRPLSRILMAFLAGVVTAAVALGAFMLGQREPGRPAARPAPPVLITAPEPPLTVTVDASSSTAAAIPTLAPSPQSDRTRDQWLLDNLRSLGYVIINPLVVIHKAHEACRLFQQDKSPEQVNRHMSATTGMNMDDTVQLTSSAMLAYYPNCA